MLNTLNKLKIQVNLLKFLSKTGKPDSTVANGARGYHLQVIDKFHKTRRGGLSSESLPYLFEVLPSTGCSGGVVSRLRSASYHEPLRRASSSASYFDYVDAEEAKNEVKEKIYKLLFPNKVVNMVDYFRKRKEDKIGSTKESPVLKVKPSPKVAKPQLKPAPPRKNYASFAASNQEKVLLPKVVNVNGVEVINGKVVLDKLEKQKELIKREEEEAQRISAKTKLSSREYLYMLNKKHRLAVVKPSRIAVKAHTLKTRMKKGEGFDKGEAVRATEPSKDVEDSKAEVDDKESGQTAPPRKDYSMFLKRKTPRSANNYTLHGIELFKGSSALANMEESGNPKPNSKVLYFDHMDSSVAVKVPLDRWEAKKVKPSKRSPLPLSPSSKKKVEEESAQDFIRRRQREFV